MTGSPIELPKCTKRALECLFSEAFDPDSGVLNWNEIKFKSGIPWPQSLQKSIKAHVRPNGDSVDVYLATELQVATCNDYVFQLIAHEMIHVVQIKQQPSFPGFGRLHGYTARYLSGFLSSGFLDYKSNSPEEAEAYRFQAALKECMDDGPTVGHPCGCTPASTSTGSTSPAAKDKAFCTAIKIDCPDLANPAVESGTIAPLGSFALGMLGGGALLSGLFGSLPLPTLLSGLLVVALAALAGLATASFGRWLTNLGVDEDLVSVGGWTLSGAAAGLFFGPVGLLFGFVGGLFAGLLDLSTGVFSGAIAWAASAAAVVLEPIVETIGAIGEFLFGPGPKPLRLMFSVDGGSEWGESYVVGASAEPPALAFDQHGNIVVAFTGEADWVVMRLFSGGQHVDFGLPVKTGLGWDYAGDDSGPALAHEGNTLAVLWRHRDNKLALREWDDIHSLPSGSELLGKPGFTSHIHAHLSERRSVLATVHDDGQAGVCYANGRIYVAWIRKNRDNTIGIKSSDDGGATWREELAQVPAQLIVSFNLVQADNHGSAALAYTEFTPAGASVQRRLFLSWAGRSSQRIYLTTFSVEDDGRLTQLTGAVFTGVHSADKAGPALCAGDASVFLAWVGRNKGYLHVWPWDLNSEGIPEGREGFDHKRNYKCRDNAGPALAYLKNPSGGPGLLALSWVEKA